MRVYLLGFMSSGKTKNGKTLAENMNMDFIDLDGWIEEEESMSVNDIFAEKGADAFRKLEKKYLTQSAELENTIISCGGGTPCFFDNIDFIKKNGTSVFINPSPKTIFDRLIKKGKEKRPLIKDMDDDVLYQYICEKLEKRLPYYTQADWTFSPDNEEIEAAIAIEQWLKLQ